MQVKITQVKDSVSLDKTDQKIVAKEGILIVRVECKNE